MALNVQTTKAKGGKGDGSKLKNFCAVKKTIHGMEGQPAE
jgi:hypothetical protein